MTRSEAAIDVIVSDARWNAIEIERIARRACEAALAQAESAPRRCEIAVLACSDDRIAELNAGFRNRGSPTNVLSWPVAPSAADPEPACLGNIAIALETCSREARVAGLGLADHVSHLVIHGCLHLLGFDHGADEEARAMEAIEIRALATLGIASPY